MADSEEMTTRGMLISNGWKFVIKLTCCFFIVIGICAVCFAIYFMMAVISPTMMISSYLLLPSLILFVCGILLIFVTCFGTISVDEENMKILRKCFYALSVLILLSIIFGVYTPLSPYARDKNRSKTILQQAIADFHNKTSASKGINSIQTTLQCCGIMAPQDWTSNVVYNCTDFNEKVHRCSVPPSCCIRDKNDSPPWHCGFRVLTHSPWEDSEVKLENAEGIYVDGCLGKIEELIFSTEVYLTIAFIVLAVVKAFLWYIILHIWIIHKSYSYQRSRTPQSIRMNTLSIMNVD